MTDDARMKLLMFGYYEERYGLDAVQWERAAEEYIFKGGAKSDLSLVDYINAEYERFDGREVLHPYIPLTEVEIQRFVADLDGVGRKLGYAVTYQRIPNPDYDEDLGLPRFKCELVFHRRR